MLKWLFNAALSFMVYICKFFMRMIGIPTPHQMANKIKRFFLSDKAQRAWRRRVGKRSLYNDSAKALKRRRWRVF